MSSNALTSVLWFVGIGAVFYFMTRGGGCGAHRHGGAGRHQHGDDEGRGAHPMESAPTPASPGEAPGASPVDPVCGMPVTSTSSELQRRYMDRTFFFCSQDCLRKFDADPPSYVRARAGTGSRRRAHGC